MKKWNLQECMSSFEIEKKNLDIGDNIAITYKGDFIPIKINGVMRKELKQFKGNYCIYEMDKSEYFSEHEVEILVLEEYSDSPYSIYINELGEVDSYEYGEITSIEIGSEIILKVTNNIVVGYHLVKQD